MANKIGIAFGVAGAMFIGYCIYFDKKRRSDPEYRKKVTLRREAAKRKLAERFFPWPDFKNPADVQRFFMQRMQEGEEMLATGDIEGGTQSMAQALNIYGQPDEILTVIQRNMSKDAFSLLLRKMTVVNKSLREAVSSLQPGQDVVSEDVE